MDCFGNGLVDILSNRLNSIHLDSAKAKEMALFIFFHPWMEFLSHRKCRSPRVVCWINWISVSYLTHLFVVKPGTICLKFYANTIFPCITKSIMPSEIFTNEIIVIICEVLSLMCSLPFLWMKASVMLRLVV